MKKVFQISVLWEVLVHAWFLEDRSYLFEINLHL